MPDSLAERLEAIAAAIMAHRYTFTSEAMFQAQVAQVLEAAGIPAVREAPLGDGRVDFMAWASIGVELKIKGSPAAVMRQLQRYAADPACAALVLVTARRALGHVPPVLEGKPTKVVALWRTFLGSTGG
jgi:hypothetical protein